SSNATPVYHGSIIVTDPSTSCNSASANPGLSNGACAATGASTAVTVAGPDMMADFYGEIASHDSVNASDDSGGRANYSSSGTFDWGNFNNPYRSWARSPDKGRWTSGVLSIFDFQLVNSGSVILNRTKSGGST